ncbi:hypothetical protein ABIE02_000279 [Leclercia sp. 1548]|uniref:hypothetical protein n=1 Tax=Leclercia TaxID=83654 RepID=UPI003016F953
MSKFTKEQLVEYVKGCIEHAERFPGVEIADKEKAIFEIALAALTAPTEPVYQYRIRNEYNGQVTEWQTIRRDQVDFVLKAQPLNAEFQIIAPSAPEVPKECPSEIRDLMASHSDALFDDDDAQEIWNACRAAMLQGAKKVVKHEAD